MDPLVPQALNEFMPESVPHHQLLRDETVRGLLGGITRETLFSWSRDRRFPQPVDVDGIELWDRREVGAWIVRNHHVVRAAKTSPRLTTLNSTGPPPRRGAASGGEVAPVGVSRSGPTRGRPGAPG